MIIHYTVTDYNCHTPCPHEEIGYIGINVIKVGSIACTTNCKYFICNNLDNSITCSKELPLPNVDKLPTLPDLR